MLTKDCAVPSPRNIVLSSDRVGCLGRRILNICAHANHIRKADSLCVYGKPEETESSHLRSASTEIAYDDLRLGDEGIHVIGPPLKHLLTLFRVLGSVVDAFNATLFVA